MKALSIRQPWAWLIVHGYKDIENRTWNTNFRGRILIHAGLKFDKQAYFEICKRKQEIGLNHIPKPEDFERGGIVGEVTIDNVITQSNSMWHDPECYGFVLKHPHPCEFIPCKGMLGVFEINV